MADRSQEKSWTVGDLMKKSELISEGTPALYRLITTRSNLDESGKIRKWTFGQREVNTENKIILLVGETGSGKTTLINAIVNYTLGVKFEDHVWFEITEEAQNQTEDQTESQTTEITVYEVFIQNNLSVTIIDTPGYGDTRGLKHDEIIADNLLKLFENDTGVKEIDAVCLVVKATQNRLSDRQHYIFDAVLSLFGEDIEENIVIFATHSNGRHPKNVISAIKKINVPCKKKNGSDPVYFLFDNCQAEEQTEEEEEEALKTWKLTEKSLKEFFTSLEIQNRKSLMKTKTVLIEQIRLKACVSNLCERIQFKESKHDELIQIQTALQKNQKIIQENGDFSFTVIRSHKEKVTSVIKVTSCNTCKENCHENCTVALKLSWCKVMKKGNCTVCRGNCPHSKHVKEKKKYEIRSVPDQIKYTELIKQYESTGKPEADMNLDSKKFEELKKGIEENKTEAQEKVSIEEKLSKELTEIEQEKTQLMKEAGDTIKKLSDIALKPDSAFIVDTLDFLILRAEETGPSAWVEELKEMRKTEPAVQEGVAATLKYMGEGLTKGFKSLFTKK